MEKKAMFRILSYADSAEVVALGSFISKHHRVSTLKKPQKTLVMLKVRESAQNTLFYAGEALACECMVSIGDAKGFAACLGDDMEKVYAMAIIDASFNSGIPECEMIVDTLRGWEDKTREEHLAQARLTMATKVDFSVMEE